MLRRTKKGVKLIVQSPVREPTLGQYCIKSQQIHHYGVEPYAQLSMRHLFPTGGTRLKPGGSNPYDDAESDRAFLWLRRHEPGTEKCGI